MLFVNANAAPTASLAPPAGAQSGDTLLLLAYWAGRGAGWPPALPGWDLDGRDTSASGSGFAAYRREADGSSEDTAVFPAAVTLASMAAYRGTGQVRANTGGWAQGLSSGPYVLPALAFDDHLTVVGGFLISTTTANLTAGAGWAQDAVLTPGLRAAWVRSPMPDPGPQSPEVDVVSGAQNSRWWGQVYAFGGSARLRMIV